MSVAKGRPERLTSPPGGSERSERGGIFILIERDAHRRGNGERSGDEREQQTRAEQR